MVSRCEWVGENPLMIAYHDQEWGVPVYDDRKLFEFLLLDHVDQLGRVEPRFQDPRGRWVGISGRADEEHSLAFTDWSGKVIGPNGQPVPPTESPPGL